MTFDEAIQAAVVDLLPLTWAPSATDSETGDTVATEEALRRILREHFGDLAREHQELSVGRAHWWHRMREVAKELGVKNLAEVLPKVKEMERDHRAMEALRNRLVCTVDSYCYGKKRQWMADREEQWVYANDPAEAILKAVERDRVQEPTCLDCGLPYSEFFLDVTLPDGQWAMVHPDVNGLLCANCIVRRAAGLPGVIAIRATIDFGGASDGSKKGGSDE